MMRRANTALSTGRHLLTLTAALILLLPLSSTALAMDDDTVRTAEIIVRQGESVKETLTLVNTFNFSVSGQLVIPGKDCEDVPTLRLLGDDAVELDPGEEVRIKVEVIVQWRDKPGWVDYHVRCELDEDSNASEYLGYDDVTLLTIDIFVARNPWPYVILIIICMSSLWLLVRWRRGRRVTPEEILERNMD